MRITPSQYRQARDSDGHTRKLRTLRRPAGSDAFTLVETMVAATVIIIAFGATMHSMVQLNRRASISRIQTNARAIVQRNIDHALAERFTASVTPAILGTTSASGSNWDDDGGDDNSVSVVVQNGTGTTTIPGALTRTVTDIPNANNAVLRRITFSLAYQYQGKPYSYASSTIRSRD